MSRAALLSVSDRTGLIEFARGLRELDFILLVTSGTGKYLGAAGIETQSIEEYTGQREILDGRVKTLHPRIHAGILARRDVASHRDELTREKILLIDVVAVNLYPFVKNTSGAAPRKEEEMIELVDVGGPTMIRAASKNFQGVLPVIDPQDYSEALELLAAEGKGGTTAATHVTRRRFAAKVFETLAFDNLAVARYFGGLAAAEGEAADLFSSTEGFVGRKAQSLRYGENPHQRASFYRSSGGEAKSWTQLSGKELSYNNLLDLDAALKLIRALGTSQPGAIIIKHLNPCGAAYDKDVLAALRKAKKSDPRSHFGGIIAVNGPITAEVAQEVRGDFAEIVIAPHFDAAGLAELKANKNLRVIQFNPLAESERSYEYRSIEGGMLVQEPDCGLSPASAATVVSAKKPTAAELSDLQFAWTLCAHVRSNAIVVVKDGTLIGVGAGQMSRIDSVEVALWKARTHSHDLKGAVAASDAFFPFPDGFETLAKAGITAVIAPKGAKRDEDVIAAANAQSAALLFAGDRHFRH